MVLSLPLFCASDWWDHRLPFPATSHANWVRCSRKWNEKSKEYGRNERHEIKWNKLHRAIILRSTVEYLLIEFTNVPGNLVGVVRLTKWNTCRWVHLVRIRYFLAPHQFFLPLFDFCLDLAQQWAKSTEIHQQSIRWWLLFTHCKLYLKWNTEIILVGWLVEASIDRNSVAPLIINWKMFTAFSGHLNWPQLHRPANRRTADGTKKKIKWIDTHRTSIWNIVSNNAKT